MTPETPFPTADDIAQAYLRSHAIPDGAQYGEQLDDGTVYACAVGVLVYNEFDVIYDDDYDAFQEQRTLLETRYGESFVEGLDNGFTIASLYPYDLEREDDWANIFSKRTNDPEGYRVGFATGIAAWDAVRQLAEGVPA